MATIPAKEIVQILPNVLSAGGEDFILNGIFLTQNTRAPIGAVLGFRSPDDVGSYFGYTSAEYSKSIIYFLGWDNSTKKPGTIYFRQFPASDVAAYLRGASVAALTIPELQSLSGDLSIVIDGATRAASNIDLLPANSYSAVGALLTAALNAAAPAKAAFTGSISGTTLTVSAVASGTLAVGQKINSAGIMPDTQITALGSGTGLTGTYTVSKAQTVASGALTTVAADAIVAFDAQSGAFVVSSTVKGTASTIAYATGSLAAPLGLASTSGGVLSQGALAGSTQTPAAFMTELSQSFGNWGLFTTLFDPDNGDGCAQKLAFAAWTNSQNRRFAYIATDKDPSPTNNLQASTSFGALVAQAKYDGVAPIWRKSGDCDIAAFIMGCAASIDFDAINGRITFAFKGQEGLIADVTNETAANNLVSNGYNFYGAYATAAQQFVLLYPGQVSGKFKWLDSYANQIWLNANLQQAIMVMMTTVNSIPYNDVGYSMVETACLDPIERAKNCGVIREGVTLTKQQAATIDKDAGKKVSGVVTANGYYLQVLDAAPITREARKSPPCNFWYTDGQSIHKIVLNSVEVM